MLDPLTCTEKIIRSFPRCQLTAYLFADGTVEWSAARLAVDGPDPTRAVDKEPLR